MPYWPSSKVGADPQGQQVATKSQQKKSRFKGKKGITMVSYDLSCFRHLDRRQVLFTEFLCTWARRLRPLKSHYETRFCAHCLPTYFFLKDCDIIDVLLLALATKLVLQIFVFENLLKMHQLTFDFHVLLISSLPILRRI